MKRAKNKEVISSDDPQAIQKLETKLGILQKDQDLMKTINKLVKKNDKEGFLLLPDATEKIWEEMITPDHMGYTGFPPYALTNNSGNMRNIKQRIATLQKQAATPAMDETINGIRIFENKDANRLQIIFKGKPAEDVRTKLKSCGFRWAPSEGAWQKHISRGAIYDATEIVNAIPSVEKSK